VFVHDCFGNHLRGAYPSHQHYVTYQAINYEPTMVKKEQ